MPCNVMNIPKKSRLPSSDFGLNKPSFQLGQRMFPFEIEFLFQSGIRITRTIKGMYGEVRRPSGSIGHGINHAGITSNIPKIILSRPVDFTCK